MRCQTLSDRLVISLYLVSLIFGLRDGLERRYSLSVLSKRNLTWLTVLKKLQFQQLLVSVCIYNMAALIPAHRHISSSGER